MYIFGSRLAFFRTFTHSSLSQQLTVFSSHETVSSELYLRVIHFLLYSAQTLLVKGLTYQHYVPGFTSAFALQRSRQCDGILLICILSLIRYDNFSQATGVSTTCSDILWGPLRTLVLSILSSLSTFAFTFSSVFNR